MQRVFISDLHLDDPAAPAFARFGECLRTEAQHVDEIYILGDLVEMWIGDDDDSACASQLRNALAAAVAHCPVFVMHGNRDFLMGASFAQDTGVTLIDDPHLTPDGLLLSHGDHLCTDDLDYQELRLELRSREWQTDILAKSLDERQAFGQDLRLQSQSANANKPANIMDINTAEAAKLVLDYGARVLVHGHTHRPGIHHGESYTRIVTGAWDICGWLCRQRDERLTLECFSLAHHYGT